MGEKIFNLTTQGHRVMGALATFLVPKLATDAAPIQSVELERVCKSISPGRYDKQIEGIIGTVKDQFGTRLAQDTDLNDLRRSLSALMPLSLAMDKAKEEEANDENNAEDKKAKDSDDDSNDDSNDALPPEFLKNIKKKKKAKDMKACDKGEDDEEDEEDEDDEDDENEKGKGEDKKAKDAAKPNPNINMKNDIGNMKPGAGADSAISAEALDAAIATARNEGAELALRRLAARYEAADVVKPIVGKVNVMSCDSAAAIYKMALDAKGIDTTGFPRSSYGAVLKAVLKSEVKPKARFAQDKAVTKTLLDEFPKLPGLA